MKYSRFLTILMIFKRMAPYDHDTPFLNFESLKARASPDPRPTPPSKDP
jgi:hypothetical protein